MSQAKFLHNARRAFVVGFLAQQVIVLLLFAYNSRLSAPEIIVDGAQYAITRPRPTYDALFAQETIADWLPKPTRKK